MRQDGMRLAFVLALALAACGGSKPSSGSSIVIGNGASTSEPDAAATPLRSVCALGDRSDGHGLKVEPCTNGAQCCYPCGIEGCDSVCMDVSQTGGCPMYP